MRNRCLAILALAVCLALAACGAKVGEDTYARIETGMSVEQVEDILGKATETSGGGANLGGMEMGATVKTWKSGDKTITVTFANGKATLKTKSGF